MVQGPSVLKVWYQKLKTVDYFVSSPLNICVKTNFPPVFLKSHFDMLCLAR